VALSTDGEQQVSSIHIALAPVALRFGGRRGAAGETVLDWYACLT